MTLSEHYMDEKMCWKRDKKMLYVNERKDVK